MRVKSWPCGGYVMGEGGGSTRLNQGVASSPAGRSFGTRLHIHIVRPLGAGAPPG